jgi:hypothetical protein
MSYHLSAEQIEELCQNQTIIPAKGDLPAVILAGTQAEIDRPLYKAFLTHIHLAREVRISSILLARVYVLALRVDRVLLVRFPESQVVDRICSALQRVACRAFEFSVRNGEQSYV